MAYIDNKIVARPAYAGLSGIWDDFKSGAGKFLDFYGQSEQAKGAQNALMAQQSANYYAMQNQGPGLGTLLVLGAVGVGVVMLIKRKKQP